MCTAKELIEHLSAFPAHSIIYVATPNPYGEAWSTHFDGIVNTKQTKIRTFGEDDYREGKVYITLRGSIE